MDSLVRDLDKDLEQFIEERIKNSQNQPRYCNFDGMTTDEIADEMKQHPAFMTEFDESKPLTPALEALQILKYESQSNNENASSYKEDGNKNFERKKYRWAVDNYTAGINCKPTDKQLLTVLYTNRAAAQFHIGNYRSSLNDCMLALQTSQCHKKAWLRALKCYIKLQKYSDILTWCDKALYLFPDDSEFLEARNNSEQQLKKLQRDERMAKAKERKLRNAKLRIVDAIKSRNIRSFSMKRGVQGLTDDEWVDLVTEEYNGAQVQFLTDTSGLSFLSWPVLFLYPEHNQSDFVVSFHENARFIDQLEAMFGKDALPAGWDEEHLYKPETIEIFFEERKSNDECLLHSTNPNIRLIDIMQSNRFKLCHSTITFFLLIKNSDFKKRFIESYGK